MSLRRATQADRGFAESINRTNMDAYRQALGIAWDASRFEAAWLQFDNRMILADGTPVGVLRLLASEGALEIRDLQVLREWQGRGIGTWALAQAQAIASMAGLPALRLRVYPANPARRLYARLEFAVSADEGDVLQMTRWLRADGA